jgi:hypothetical protein
MSLITDVFCPHAPGVRLLISAFVKTEGNFPALTMDICKKLEKQLSFLYLTTMNLLINNESKVYSA